MLLDASGAALPPASPPPPAATPPVDHLAIARQLQSVRRTLRMQFVLLAKTVREQPEGAVMQLPIADLFAFVSVAVTAVDVFLDARAVDGNGVKQPMSDSAAVGFDKSVDMLIEHIVQQNAQHEAKPKLQLVGADALDALPMDPRALLQGGG